MASVAKTQLRQGIAKSDRLWAWRVSLLRLESHSQYLQLWLDVVTVTDMETHTKPTRNEYGSYYYRNFTIYRDGNSRNFLVRYGRTSAGVYHEKTLTSLRCACLFIDKISDAK